MKVKEIIDQLTRFYPPDAEVVSMPAEMAHDGAVSTPVTELVYNEDTNTVEMVAD